MADMEIRSTGEVLFGGFQVATITFDTPTAHYDLVGTCGEDGECHCCVNEEEWEDLQRERDDLDDDLTEAKAKCDDLTDQLAKAREKLAVAERELARRAGGGVAA